MDIKINILILYFIGIIIASNMNKSIIDKDVVIEKATFGAGCFWCVEAVFERLDGVKDVQVGYTGGNVVNPTYADVCSGETGHVEVVLLDYNPQIISFQQLLDRLHQMAVLIVIVRSRSIWLKLYLSLTFRLARFL